MYDFRMAVGLHVSFDSVYIKMHGNIMLFFDILVLTYGPVLH